MLEQCGRPSCRVLLSRLTSEIGIIVVRLKRRKRESTQLGCIFKTRTRIRLVSWLKSVDGQAFCRIKKESKIRMSNNNFYHRSFRNIHSHRTSIFQDFESVSFLLIQGSIGLWPTFDTTKRGYLLLSTTRIFFQYTVPPAHFFFRIRPRNFIEKICFPPLRQFRSTGRRGSPSFFELLRASPSSPIFRTIFPRASYRSISIRAGFSSRSNNSR